MKTDPRGPFRSREAPTAYAGFRMAKIVVRKVSELEPTINEWLQKSTFIEIDDVLFYAMNSSYWWIFVFFYHEREMDLTADPNIVLRAKVFEESGRFFEVREDKIDRLINNFNAWSEEERPMDLVKRVVLHCPGSTSVPDRGFMIIYKKRIEQK